MSYTKKYYPKRPVKSFQDLEVYQKTLGLAVEIGARVGRTARKSLEIEQSITESLVLCVLEIPELIAGAHSLRFGDSTEAIVRLEKAMLGCNLAVVYLELYRDLVNGDRGQGERGQDVKRRDNVGTEAIEHAFFEEQIKEYLRVRGKIMRLQKAWITRLNLEEKG